MKGVFALQRSLQSRIAASMAVLVLACACGAATATDRVRFQTPDGPRDRFGTVVEFNGADGAVVVAGDRETRIPAKDVLEIETQRSESQLAGLEAYSAGDYTTALARLTEARQSERRAWMQRELTADIVRCHRAMGQTAYACSEFARLAGLDPLTPHLDCIPLAWRTSRPPIGMEGDFRRWLAHPASPAMQLLAAGYMQSGESRNMAGTALQSLSRHTDERIASLAKAQQWRMKMVQADLDDADFWRSTVDDMPETLRAGPYYIVGKAYERNKAPRQAALAWMHVPILYPDQPAIAAECLAEAADAFETQGQAEHARRAWKEIVEQYADMPQAEVARKKLASQDE